MGRSGGGAGGSILNGDDDGADDNVLGSDSSTTSQRVSEANVVRGPVRKNRRAEANIGNGDDHGEPSQVVADRSPVLVRSREGDICMYDTF